MRVSVDLAKASIEIVDLSDKLNPRVGDGGLSLPFHITNNGEVVDMHDNDIEFISQDPDGNDIYVSGTVDTSTNGDNAYQGDVTFKFPQGTFKVPGNYDTTKTMFRIVSNNTVLSTVNVKLNVLPDGTPEFNFDPTKTGYNSRLEDLLKQYQDEHDKKIADIDKQGQDIINSAKDQATKLINDTQAQVNTVLSNANAQAKKVLEDATTQTQQSLDEIKQLNNEAKGNVAGDTATTANQAKSQANLNAGLLHDQQKEIGEARGRYTSLSRREIAQDDEINRKEDRQNANENYAAISLRDDGQDKEIAKKADMSFIMDYLSKMKLEPEGVKTSSDLTTLYPNGHPGLMIAVDTGHAWVWSDVDKKWTDCGQYQVIGLDNTTINKISGMIGNFQQDVLDNKTKIADHEQRLTKDEATLEDDRRKIVNVYSAGHFADFDLMNQVGEYVTDESGHHISVNKWNIITDKTLTKSDVPADAKAVGDSLIEKPEKYGFPTMYLYGDKILTLHDKKGALTSDIRYSFPAYNISGNLKKLKVQGASTATLPKKNYTIVFDQPVEIFPNYGMQKKYVLKANMTDYSQLRNIGCAKLWGNVRQLRIKAADAIKADDQTYLTDSNGNHITGETDPQLSIGGDFGAVDGFPIAVYINGEYWGLYTFNIPKDGWMAKMSNKYGNAIVSANYALFDHHTNLKEGYMGLEYCGTLDSDWVVKSVNNLIDSINTTYKTQADFDNAVTPLLDLDSAIDYYAYSVMINNTDGMTRNYLLQTFDSKKWYFAVYDIDLAFGRTAATNDFQAPDYGGSHARMGGITFENLTSESKIFAQLWKFHKADILARYKKLANSVMSSAQVGTDFTNWQRLIPLPLINEEAKVWPSTTHSSTNNIEQIRWWYTERINFLNRLVTEEEQQSN